MSRKAMTNYRDLRWRLIRAGYSLRSFALAFGYKIPTVYCAARGTRAGVISRKILSHMEEIANAQ